MRDSKNPIKLVLVTVIFATMAIDFYKQDKGQAGYKTTCPFIVCIILPNIPYLLQISVVS